MSKLDAYLDEFTFVNSQEVEMAVNDFFTEEQGVEQLSFADLMLAGEIADDYIKEKGLKFDPDLVGTKTTEEKIKLTLTVDDVKELLPDEKFEYQMYWDYRDVIDEKTFEHCMPEEDSYRDENGIVNYENFVQDWRCNLKDEIYKWNIDFIIEDIHRCLTEEVEEALEKKGIEYDELEFDFYPDDLYSINMDIEYLLGRSRINWNMVWHSNFDGFYEGETYEDERALKQFIDLFPDMVKKEDLENACNEGIYSGSDLKVSFRHSMKDFLDIISNGEKVDVGGNAVLHLGLNGSGSPEFPITGYADMTKTYGTQFDGWDWEFDGHYGIVDVYGGVLNNYY